MMLANYSIVSFETFVAPASGATKESVNFINKIALQSSVRSNQLACSANYNLSLNDPFVNVQQSFHALFFCVVIILTSRVVHMR